MKTIKNFINEEKGMVAVEAAILFPIIILSFFALLLLCMYLPTKAVLQNATQTAANAISVCSGDTWIGYDETSLAYKSKSADELKNVYYELIATNFINYDETATAIVKSIHDNSVVPSNGTLTVESNLKSFVVYKEIEVTAVKRIEHGLNLSVIGFPDAIQVGATSTAVIQNPDEFIRNIDIAVDVIKWADGKYNISSVFGGITPFLDKAKDFLS